MVKMQLFPSLDNLVLATFNPGDKASNEHSAAAGLVGVMVDMGVSARVGDRGRTVL